MRGTALRPRIRPDQMCVISTGSGPQLLRAAGESFGPVEITFGIRAELVDTPVEPGR